MAVDQTYLFWVLDQNDVSYSLHVSNRLRLDDSVLTINKPRDRFSWFQNNESIGRILRQLDAKASCLSTNDRNRSFNTEDFKLIQAQVIFRHGARTPIWTIPTVPEARYDRKIFRAVLSHCDFDYKVTHISGSKAEGFEESAINKRYGRVLEGGVKLGQLTTVGMQQCFDLGLTLRRRYINQYKLLNSEFDEREVYFRSTYVLRTLESLQGVVAGIYGVDQLTGDKIPRFDIAYYNEEHLYPNPFLCDCLKEIANHGSRRLTNPSRQVVLDKVHTALNHDKSKKDLDFVAVRDDLYARDAHGRGLPPSLVHLFNDIHKQASIDFVQKIAGMEKERSAGLMLALGPFHHLLLNSMERAIGGKSRSKKLCLYSSHDSMIMPLLVAMGCYEWDWPPYAAYLAYELWQHTPSSRYFVKVIYNQKELSLPGKGKLIPFEEFKDFLAPFTVEPKRWEYLCEHTRTEIESPPVEYSLHYEYDDSAMDVSPEEEDEEQGQAPTGM